MSKKYCQNCGKGTELKKKERIGLQVWAWISFGLPALFGNDMHERMGMALVFGAPIFLCGALIYWFFDLFSSPAPICSECDTQY